MNREEAYKIAVDMFGREHARWTQNALILFGGLISAFLTDRYSAHLFIVLLIAIMISCTTVFVALTIRASTDAWRMTIRVIEGAAAHDQNIRPFAIFRRHMRRYERHHRYRKDFCYIVCPHRRWIARVLFSVTRLYTLLAAVLALLFTVVLLVQSFLMLSTLWLRCMKSIPPECWF